MRVPLMDMKAQYRGLQEEIDAAIRDVMEKAQFILGPNVKALEQEIAQYSGCAHGIGVASGTDALILALRALGIGAGDEVIIPAYTFFATAGAVFSVGAVPVLVDIEADCYGIDTNLVEKSLTDNTKAIIPVHLYGHPANMAQVTSIAKKYGLKIIEDNAQAFGAEFQGRKTGGLGDAGCQSFFPSKNLGGCGDGGMVVTNNEEVAERIRMLRTHGWKKKYEPETIGYNSRLDELQAAILRVKFQHIDSWNQRRRELAALYSQHLQGTSVITPTEREGARHAFHLYMIRVKNREAVQARLKENEIDSAVYYPLPLHQTEPFMALGYCSGNFPVAEAASQETLSIPIYPEMSEEQVEWVAQVLASQ